MSDEGWRIWFAWHPVAIGKHWIWWRYVLRRKRCWNGFMGQNCEWEYYSEVKGKN